MSPGAELLAPQIADYQAVLEAAQALAAGDLSPERVADYLTLRDATEQRTAPREAPLGQAFATLPAVAVARYRALLEALVQTEALIVAQARTQGTELTGQLAQLEAGRRALAGYRPAADGRPQAISQRV